MTKWSNYFVELFGFDSRLYCTLGFGVVGFIKEPSSILRPAQRVDLHFFCLMSVSKWEIGDLKHLPWLGWFGFGGIPLWIEVPRIRGSQTTQVRRVAAEWWWIAAPCHSHLSIYFNLLWRLFCAYHWPGGNSMIFGIFIPIPGKMMHFDEHIFQMG